MQSAVMCFSITSGLLARYTYLCTQLRVLTQIRTCNCSTVTGPPGLPCYRIAALHQDYLLVHLLRCFPRPGLLPRLDRVIMCQRSLGNWRWRGELQLPSPSPWPRAQLPHAVDSQPQAQLTLHAYLHCQQTRRQQRLFPRCLPQNSGRAQLSP